MSSQMKDFGGVISRLINGEDISREEAKASFAQILKNEQSEMQQGAFLAALTAKGETVEETVGCWEAIYELDTVKVELENELSLVENCGTGMDAVSTFNISTAAAIVAATAGINMARHGSRSITSVCGTVDILEELGMDVECTPEVVVNSITEAGIGLFNGMSPQVHPQALGRILSQISFGTTLNIAASLANPVLPEYGVRGVYTKELVLPVAKAMKKIGYKKAIVVCGLVGDEELEMDEASTLGQNFIAELKADGEIVTYSFSPEDLGIAKPDIKEIAPAKSRHQEAQRILALLSGKGKRARRDIVALNAALIFYLMDYSSSFAEGYYKAGEIIDSGQAVDKLREWVRAQNVEPEKGVAKLDTLLNAV
ncbi:anthranilate phosphoribosyltransferase [Fuchsiella alkaliacetigena]|uniref:anthranilate phosphoribosyltransferase n=1 Tax=Fuchsiella alkaliacetigena TaxID=957042 RepID=UPI00200A8FA9|nr:anthranilate phosphoribosyltransferase [Fuchsiella alkaliacetigena]MCK8823661.1 anthranilate phosphoribosyltransferase [Fuchsiella alkaliacetigena]